MSDNNNQHETQQLTDYTEAQNKEIHSMMEDAQRIEGAGPPKKVDFRTLPKPLRVSYQIRPLNKKSRALAYS